MHTKHCGSKEKLEKTAAYILQTGLWAIDKEEEEEEEEEEEDCYKVTKATVKVNTLPHCKQSRLYLTVVSEAIINTDTVNLIRL